MKSEKLPKKLIPFPNPDKVLHEKWSSHRDPGAIIRPFRALFCGQPNCGKGNMIKNIIARSDFDTIRVWHVDPETEEWNDLGDQVVISDQIPMIQDFNPDVYNLLIIDDIDWKGLPREEKSIADRLMGYASTHRNISVCICAQDFFCLPSNIRRMANFITLWRPNDNSLEYISKKVGLSMSVLKEIFEDCVKDIHDSISFDFTHKSPYKIRLNLYKIIDIE